MLNQHPRLDLKVQLELEHLLRYQLLLPAFNLNLLQSQSLQQDVHGILLNLLLTLWFFLWLVILTLVHEPFNQYQILLLDEIVVDVDEVSDSDVQVLVPELKGVKEEIPQQHVLKGLDLDAQQFT